MDKETTFKKAKKQKGTPDNQFLGDDHHRFRVVVTLDDVLQQMPDVSAEAKKAYKVGYKKAVDEKTKKTEKEENEWLRTCVEVKRFTDPFFKMLTSVLQSCASEQKEVTDNEFTELMKVCGKIFSLNYDFSAFVMELHAIFPTLEDHLKSKKKNKDAKNALKYFQNWYDVCWDETSGKPKEFLKARTEYLKGDFQEMGL